MHRIEPAEHPSLYYTRELSRDQLISLDAVRITHGRLSDNELVEEIEKVLAQQPNELSTGVSSISQKNREVLSQLANNLGKK